MNKDNNSNNVPPTNDDMYEAMKAYVATGGGMTYKARKGFWGEVWLACVLLSVTWLALAIFVAGVGALNISAIIIGALTVAIFGKLSLVSLKKCSDELNELGTLVEAKLSLGQRLVKKALEIREAK